MWEKNGISKSCSQIASFVTKNKDKVPVSLLEFFTANASNKYFKRIDKARIMREQEADRASGALS